MMELTYELIRNNNYASAYAIFIALKLSKRQLSKILQVEDFIED